MASNDLRPQLGTLVQVKDIEDKIYLKVCNLDREEDLPDFGIFSENLKNIILSNCCLYRDSRCQPCEEALEADHYFCFINIRTTQIRELIIKTIDCKYDIKYFNSVTREGVDLTHCDLTEVFMRLITENAIEKFKLFMGMKFYNFNRLILAFDNLYKIILFGIASRDVKVFEITWKLITRGYTGWRLGTFNDQYKALMLDCINDDNLEIFKLLLRYGFFIRNKDELMKSILSTDQALRIQILKDHKDP